MISGFRNPFAERQSRLHGFRNSGIYQPCMSDGIHKSGNPKS